MDTTVLLVTSNPTHIRILREHTVVNEFRWKVAQNISEAQMIIRAERCDVALAAMSLADSRGLNTYRLLREAAPEMPIVLLVRPDEESWALAALREGAQDFIVLNDSQETLPLRSIIQNAKERKHGLVEIERRTIDPDTGFYNYFGFTAAARQYLGIFRFEHRKLTCFLLRLQPSGCDALAQVSGALRGMLQKPVPHLCVGRTDHNEFAVLLQEVEQDALMRVVNESLLQRLPSNAVAVASIVIDPQTWHSIEPFLDYLRQKIAAAAVAPQ